jgi:hypothetical protein
MSSMQPEAYNPDSLINFYKTQAIDDTIHELTVQIKLSKPLVQTKWD